MPSRRKGDREEDEGLCSICMDRTLEAQISGCDHQVLLHCCCLVACGYVDSRCYVECHCTQYKSIATCSHYVHAVQKVVHDLAQKVVHDLATDMT